MKNKKSISHIALTNKNEDEANKFYNNILGFPLIKKFNLSGNISELIFRIKENVDILVFGNEEVKFEIFITKIKSKNSFEHLCIKVEDKKEFINCCKKNNIKQIKIEKDKKKLLFIRDYSGNLFEIK